MTIPEEQRDKWFDKNLRNLIDRHCGSCDPKLEQVSRWVDIATPKKRSILIRVGGFLRGHPLGSMLSTAAAAAAIIIAVVITFNASSPQISAAEVFSQLDRTLVERPIVSIEGKNLEFGGHRINMRFCGSDGGKRIYAKIQTYPLKNNIGDNVYADVVFARNGDKGWLLIRKFESNGASMLDLFMEEGESLLIPLPLSSKSKWAVESVFPQLVRISDVRGLVTSLQAAAPNLKTVRRNESLTQLQGIITVPDKLSVGDFHKSIDVSSRMHQSMVPAADDIHANLARPESSRNVDAETNDKIVDFVAEMVMQQLKDTRDFWDELLVKHREKGLRQMFVHQLKGAKITISYEPEKKLLHSITLTDIGQSRGSLSIRFYGKTFDDSLFSSDQFEKDPKVLKLTEEQILMYMAAPVMEE